MMINDKLQRCIETLKFYANEDAYWQVTDDGKCHTVTNIDQGEKARETLEDIRAEGEQAALSQQPVGDEELVRLIKEAKAEHRAGDPQTFAGWLTEDLHIARTLLARFNISDRGK